jgi:hypothetical protein
MGFNGCSLTDELALLLRCPVFGVNLPSTVSRLLLLLIVLLLLMKEPSSWLWCGSLQWDRRDGQKHQSVL